MTSMGQSGPESNSNEEYFTLPRSPELEPHHQMQFAVILKTLFVGVLPLYKGYNQFILSCTHRVTSTMSKSSKLGSPWLKMTVKLTLY